jgi:hypothetical protein
MITLAFAAWTMRRILDEKEMTRLGHEKSN